MSCSNICLFVTTITKKCYNKKLVAHFFVTTKKLVTHWNYKQKTWKSVGNKHTTLTLHMVKERTYSATCNYEAKHIKEKISPCCLALLHGYEFDP